MVNDMKKIIIFFTALLIMLFNTAIFGQTSTREEPISFKINIPTLGNNAKAQKVMPSLDMNTIILDDIRKMKKMVFLLVLATDIK